VNQLQEKIAEFELEIAKGRDDSVAVHEKLIKNLRKRLADIEAREVAMWESQVDPNPENRMPQHIFQTLTAKLVAEREEVELALKNALETLPKPIDYEQKLVRFKNALDALLDDNRSALEKNRLLKACISKLIYHRARPQRSGNVGKGQWTSPPIEIQAKLMI
jgi:hypothetical protein